jgi:hypothetical protein
MKRIDITRSVVFALSAVVAVPAFAQWSTTGSTVHPTTLTNNVGVGTDSAPTGKLTVKDDNGNTLFLVGRSSDGTGGFQFRNSADSVTLGYVIVDSSEFRFLHGSGFVSFYAGGVERMRINPFGRIGIGTTAPAEALHVNGNAIVSGTLTGGNIQAMYQDVAEWVSASEELDPGTVVVLDPENENHVARSKNSYDTSVAGVISARPGLLLGEGGKGKVKVATTGRLMIKADASHGAIKIGDLLVTSDVAGVAMKSQPIIVNGRKFHQPGTVIGKALQPLENGRGEILVLLSLQ